MAKKKVRNQKKKTLKSSIKAVTTAAMLAGGMLIGATPAAKATDVSPEVDIQTRVKTVRAALKKKIADNDFGEKELSYSEMELAQRWGNWGNWANWANWNNWRNWNNWANWGNWGNR